MQTKGVYPTMSVMFAFTLSLSLYLPFSIHFEIFFINAQQEYGMTLPAENGAKTDDLIWPTTLLVVISFVSLHLPFIPSQEAANLLFIDATVSFLSFFFLFSIYARNWKAMACE